MKELPVEYRMGFDNWDKQHAEIISILSESVTLAKSKKKNKDDLVLEVLGELQRYADVHFQYEEKKMLKLEYPGTKEHLEEHEKFASQVKEMQAKYWAEEILQVSSINVFIKEWFLNHMLVIDRKLADFIRETNPDEEFEKGPPSVKSKL